MKIEIINVVVENKGKYLVANVNYKGPDGKPEGKKIMSFANKDVFKTVSEAKTGDLFDVKLAKNEKGYWDWTEISGEGKNTSPTGEGSARIASQARGTFETPEERAKRQVYIVRQSSITAAIELAKLNGAQAPVTEEDIIRSARTFEQYVFDTGVVDAEVK